jgi:hypothetical protein
LNRRRLVQVNGSSIDVWDRQRRPLPGLGDRLFADMLRGNRRLQRLRLDAIPVIGDGEFQHDDLGDGRVAVMDAVLPTESGTAIHRGESGGFAKSASFRGRLPGDDRFGWLGSASRYVPMPRVEDTDGDSRLDLVVNGLSSRPPWVAIARGLGGARFEDPVKLDLSCLSGPAQSPASSRSVAWTGDLDGDGRIELVTREVVDTGQSDMKQVKKPMLRYRIHQLRADRSVNPEPHATLEAEGWAFSGGFRDGVDLQFLDLDGDKRKDLVTVTLDFSMFQALRALTAKKIGVGLEFHVVAQQADGSFRLVPDQKLDEKLNLDLNRLEISRLGQFQGDFDGDGRVDFVHLGKGKTVTIHRGQPGGRVRRGPRPHGSFRWNVSVLHRLRDGGFLPPPRQAKRRSPRLALAGECQNVCAAGESPHRPRWRSWRV